LPRGKIIFSRKDTLHLELFLSFPDPWIELGTVFDELDNRIKFLLLLQGKRLDDLSEKLYNNLKLKNAVTKMNKIRETNQHKKLPKNIDSKTSNHTL
jgi:hypothetical protein